MNLRRATLWAATGLLVGGIAYTSAVTTALVMERSLDPGVDAGFAAAAPAADETKVEQRPLSDYQPVLEQNIFGAARSAPREPAARRAELAGEQEAAPQVQGYELRLTGTYLAGTQSFAMAIGTGESDEKVYKVGECVPEVDGSRASPCGGRQARLTGIGREAIVMVRNGEQMEVQLTDEIRSSPRRSSSARRSLSRNDNDDRRAQALARRQEARERLAASRRRAAETTTTDTADSDDEAEDLPSGETFPMQEVGEDNFEFTVPNAEVQQAFENFSEIVGQAAAVPIIENGEPQGFELRKIRSGSIFERLGLQNNDLIHGVNGESLTTADQALRLFTLFRNEREIVLDVTRDSRRIRLAYSVE